MNRLVKASLDLEQKRKDLGVLLDATEEEQRMEGFESRVESAKAAISAAQTAHATAALAEPDVTETREKTSEGNEIRQLMGRANMGGYLRASLGRRGVTGAEAELNAALGILETDFPMDMILTQEERAAIDGDSETNQQTWLDAVFHDSAAMRLGITFPSVAAGIPSYPVTTTNISAAQRQRAETQSAGALGVTVVEFKPTRHHAYAKYSIEDAARLPGLPDAILRNMRDQIVDGVDKAIFLGASASGTEADIAGLNTLTITEKTLSQTNKVKADETLKVLVELIDGQYATSPADLRIVVSEGINQLWMTTIHTSATSTQTIAQFLRESGIAWTVRGDIETNTANNDFGAFIGLARGLAGAGVAPHWSNGTLISDPYSDADSGEVNLSLTTLWNFGLARAANFKRLKLVT